MGGAAALLDPVTGGLNATGGPPVSKAALLHATDTLAVTRFALDALQRDVAAASSAALANVYAPLQASVDALEQALHQAGVTASSGRVAAPVVWSLQTVTAFFAQTTSVAAAIDALSAQLDTDGGISGLPSASVDAALQSVQTAVDAIAAAAGSGSAPSHLVAATLRYECAAALAALASGRIEVLPSDDAKTAVMAVEALLAPLSAPGSIEAMSPAQHGQLRLALEDMLTWVSWVMQPVNSYNPV